jgi:protein O-mannosyl-transferase
MISWRHRAVILLLAAAAYGPALRVGFIWDDHMVIEQNQWLRAGVVPGVVHDFSSGLFNDASGADFYRPLQLLVHRLTFYLAGLRPAAYHAVNLLFHAVNALLVTELLVALGAAGGAAWATGALFAVHPMIVSEILMVSGLSEIMGLTWMLAALLALRSMRRRMAWGALGFYAAALLTKESAIILPAMASFMELIFPARRKIEWSLAAGAGALTLAYLILYPHVIHPSWPKIPVSLAGSFMVEAFPGVLLHYAGLMAFPWPLFSERMLPSMAPNWPWHLTVLIAFLAALTYARSHAAWACAGWFAIMLLPKAPMMIFHSLMLDHWGYCMDFVDVQPVWEAVPPDSRDGFIFALFRRRDFGCTLERAPSWKR